MSRIDPDLDGDQALVRVAERQALLPRAPADKVDRVQQQIDAARAAAAAGQGGQ